MLALALLGCGMYPFQNDPPKILSVNGVEHDPQDYALAGFEPEPGVRNEITFEVDDPEGDGVLLWFPRAPTGWVFAPDGLSGYWDAPENIDQIYSIDVIAIDDDKKDPRSTEYPIMVNQGYYYYE